MTQPTDDGRPINEVERLENERQARVTALVPLADELNEQGHPYGEELCLIATNAMHVESLYCVLQCETTFVFIRRLNKSPENDLLAAEWLEELQHLLEAQ